MRCLLVIGLAAACAPPNGATAYPKTEPPDDDLAAAAAPADAAASTDEPGLVRYFDREIDLRPFLSGFPYGRFQASLRTGKLFYFEIGDAYTLRMLDVPAAGKKWDLATGKAISEVDWSKRSLWSIHHHSRSDTLWLHADAANDEKMNLWTLALGTGELTQITRADYVYGVGFSDDDKMLAYLPRSGTKAPFRTCLRVREVEGGQDREVVCDTPALQFTWSEPRFSPDDREVYFNAQSEGDRNRVQLVRVVLDAKTPKVEVLTDPKKRRTGASALEGWVDGKSLIVRANDDGYDNLWALDRASKRLRQLTRFREDTESAELTDAGVVAVHRTPAGSTLVLVDPRTGKLLAEQKLRGTADVLGAHGTRALVRHEAPDVVVELRDVEASATKLSDRVVVELDRELAEKIVQCRARTVKIPTFDVDKATGKPRELHAFVLAPVRPPEDPAAALGLITAFYGGDNGYSEFDHVMCAAGLVVVSPAVRGSSGFGREFQALNDRDLGGDEIVDLFRVAAWLEKDAGLDADRIGVYGGSHGGYATMRALTFDPATNSRNERYPFGFGMSHAGFSDIESFYRATNIPDWVVLESGDPKVAKDLARMRARSPAHTADRLQSPLLLTHGANDWRVPVDESRRMAEAAKALERPVQYVEFEGQGHRIEGVALQVKLYQVRFDFLMAVAKAAGSTAPAHAKVGR